MEAQANSPDRILPPMDIHESPPPAQDSPNHILALNNQCLQECFSRLSTHEDFLNVSNVCQRFRANARACFPPTSLTIEPFQSRLYFRKVNQVQKFWTLESNMPSKQLGNFLCIFGDLIKSIEFDALWCDTVSSNFDKYFAKIEQHCAKTLKELSFYIFKRIINVGSAFERLEILKIHYCSIIYVEPLPRLKVLDLRYMYERKNLARSASIDRIFQQNFPQLKVLILDEIHQLNDQLIIGFQAINPQLCTLQVSYCSSVTTSILNGISARLPNLEHLTLVFDESSLSTETVNEHWTQVGEICNLKSLRSNLDQIVSTESLVNLLVENDVAVEKLYVENAYKNIEVDLRKLKSLKKFSAVHWNDSMSRATTNLGTVCVDTHQWIQELCDLN